MGSRVEREGRSAERVKVEPCVNIQAKAGRRNSPPPAAEGSGGEEGSAGKEGRGGAALQF